MAELFDTAKSTISEHLSNIYASGELTKNATIRKFRTVQRVGNRDVERGLDFYNLDAIISVGYRVNSRRATQFRQWATRVLRKFAIKGYVLDKQRLENGAFLGEADTGEQRETLEYLIHALDEDRLSNRKLFPKELKGKSW